MPERLSTTTTEAPTVDPETVAEIDSVEVDAEATPEDPSTRRLREAREHVAQLLDEYDTRKAQEAKDGEEPSPETTEPDTAELADTAELPVAEDDEDSPEKKKGFERTRGVLKKIGNWAVTSLEANGFIPIRGTWHKRDGVSAFIAKGYVWNKQRKADRLAGFLSPEANAQLNGDGESEPTSPEDLNEDNEEESRAKQIRRKVGRAALKAVRKPGRMVKTGYKTWKEIKNIAK